MKRTLLALTLSLIAATSFAATGESKEIGALRGECAARYAAKADKTPIAANEYRFVYAKGELKGEQQTGMALACTEDQYAAYLDNGADPTRVMSAYPSAAGRPTVSKK